LNGPLDGTGVLGAIRIYASYWNFNSSLYHWFEVLLSGVQTPGAVPIVINTEAAIRLAKVVITGLLGIITICAGVWAWRIDNPHRDDHETRTLGLLRLAIVPLGAYLLLTTTVHPWYVTVTLPFVIFLLPRQGEDSHLQRFLWPWLYPSWAVALSYLTYINLNENREYYLVRQIDYIPFYLLFIRSGWPCLRASITIQKNNRH